ncbi:MAG: oligosaccharide flippase family protein [Candidatus Latescibacter sp.]|nr:oligosaccharide flippase family protein [Candidatus Latescibacter sp.]
MLEEKGMGGSIGVVGSGRSVYVLSLFILNIGLARSMGTEGFGSFQQVFMFSALFMILTLGIPETLYFFLPRLTPEERPGFLGQTIILLGASGLAVCFFLWAGASFLAGVQGNPAIAPNIRIFGIYGAFLVASAFADPIFIVFKRVRYLFTLSFLHGLFFLLLTLWQYLAGVSAAPLFMAMAVFALGKFLAALFLVYRMRPEIGEILYFGGKKMLLLQLSFSLPIALSNTVDIISAWMDKFVVSVYLGKEALGVFYVGAIEIPLVSVVLASVYSVVSPVLSSHHHRKDFVGFIGLVNKTFLFTAKMIWPFCLYLFVFADRLIPLMFGPEYEASVAPFRVYLMMMPLRIALYGAIVLALGKPRAIFLAASGALLINFVLSVILVQYIRLLGPAIATVISTWFHVVILLWVILAATKGRIAELIPFRGLFMIGTVSALAVCAAFAVTRTGFFESDLQIILFSSILFTGLYVFLGKKAGFIRLLSLRDIMEGRYLGRKDGNSKG